MAIFIPGMFYHRINNPKALRYHRLIFSIPEQKVKKGRRRAGEYILSVDMGRPVAIDDVAVNPESGQAYFFELGMVVEQLSARSEASYAREGSPHKGNKILAQAPLLQDRLWAHPNRVIENFDHLFAIDTNTQSRNKEIISVSSVVYGRTTQAVVPGITSVQFDINCCIEFRGIPHRAENVAWMFLIRSLRAAQQYNPYACHGLIVNSDLSNLERYNHREVPIYDQFYLPTNMKFIYASTEISENLPNTMLALADKESKKLRDYIIREQVDQDLIPAVNEPFTHFKKWEAHMLPRR